jgi:type IV pilus assembly protein PilA
MKKLNKKGFTLAELLIVVAIIAVLVAISIPIFTAQLNKAKYAADEANARSIYSEMVADYLANGGDQKLKLNNGTSNVTVSSKGSVTVNYADGASNKYNFSGIVTITFELGTTTSYPRVTLAACDKVDASAVIFGEGTVGSGS